MKRDTKQNNTRLGGYLTAAVTCSTLVSSTQAAVVALDVSSIDGPNGGLAPTAFARVPLSSLAPGLTGRLLVYHNTNGYHGLGADQDMEIAHVGGAVKAAPKNFAAGSVIDSSSSFKTYYSYWTLFRYNFNGAPDVSPDFGPNSFIGFKSANGHYGYLEVTWTEATNTFEILSGAYEDQAGDGILAGAAAVPEPSTAVLSLGALAAGAFIRRRKQAAYC